MIDKNTLVVLGLLIVGAVVYLSFVNWHAAIVVLLFLIVANTANSNKK